MNDLHNENQNEILAKALSTEYRKNKKNKIGATAADAH